MFPHFECYCYITNFTHFILYPVSTTVRNTRVQVSSGVLYSVDFHTTSQHRTLLIVSGDEGILGFDWLAILEGGNNSNTLPLFRCKPHYSLSPVEINDFDISNNFMFGAAGDANGYKWDLETNKLLATYPSAKRGYLHSIQCMHNDSTVLMGGEDGVLGIWDGHHDKLIDNVDIQSVLHKEEHVLSREIPPSVAVALVCWIPASPACGYPIFTRHWTIGGLSVVEFRIPTHALHHKIMVQLTATCCPFTHRLVL